MGLIPFEELGDSTGSFIKKIGNGVADFACGLYRDYPWTMTGFDPTGFGKGVWDNLCAGRSPGLPVLPAPPFVGGQCVGISYLVRGYYKIARAHLGGGLDEGYRDVSLTGPIYGLFEILPPQSPSGIHFHAQDGALTFPDGKKGDQLRGLFSGDTVLESKIVSVQRLDGLPDDCGNVGGDYPHTPIPNGRKSGDIVVSNNDGTSITIPVIYAPGLKGFDATFKLADELNLTIDVGGIYFDDLGSLPKDFEDRFKALEDAVKDLLKDKEKEPEDPEEADYVIYSYFGDGSGDIRGVLGLRWVSIELLQIPKNAKRQAGKLAGDVFYSGWFQWITNDGYLQREPINFKRTMFQAPRGISGYAYTLYQGFTCQVIQYLKLESEGAES